MAERNQSTDNGLKLFIYWLVVGISTGVGNLEHAPEIAGAF
jgi:hypothetical protein